MSPSTSPGNPCSFCLGGVHEVTRMLGGPGVQICGACVAACNDILADPTIPFPGYDEEDDDTLLARLGPADAAVASADVGLRGLVDVLRARGASWARIGDALGVSRQAASERFG